MPYAVPQSSLFEYEGAPVLDGAAEWIANTLLGSVAVSLCVMAIAFIGLMMFSGRLPVRRAAFIVLGCFILLGAPVIASAFGGFWTERTSQPVTVYDMPAPEVREQLPPANYDPYAGASLRRE